MIWKLYPEGRRKAFNITYDDGVLQDVRFVELLNQYGIKGTFNLNSELMETEFSWMHPNGMEVKRLPSSAVSELYKGHEVASHTLTHPYLSQLSREEVLRQMGQDKKNLERLTGKPVLGFAGPFHYWSEMIADCAKECGFEYARTAEETYSYAPPEEYFYWAAGSYHIMPGFSGFVENFFSTDEELALCQIVGHAYDLDAENMWQQMEDILRRVSEAEDILPMSNIELVQYLKAMRSTVITENRIENTSDLPLWFEIDGQIVRVEAGCVFSR